MATFAPRRSWLIAALAIALTVALLVGGRGAMRIYFRLTGPPPPPRQTDVSAIAEWMTVPYVARAYRVPEPELGRALGITPEGRRTRTLAQLQFQRSIPQFLAAEQFNRAIYGMGHPASFVAPPAESIKKLTSKDLVDFHATNYRPNNAILAIVGDVTLKDIMPKLEKAFGDWQRAGK